MSGFLEKNRRSRKFVLNAKARIGTDHDKRLNAGFGISFKANYCDLAGFRYWRSIENDVVSVVLVVDAHSLATACRTSE